MHLYFRKAVILGFIAAALAATGCSRAASFGNGEYELDRPLVLPETTASRKKIIALGDSLTAGFGLAENESYPYLLQQKLKTEGYEYEVINAGVSGDTSLGGLERADWVLSQPNAEILILELGANDLLRGMPVDRMKSNLAGIIEKAKAKNMKILLCGMLAPPSMGSDYETNYRNAFPDLADEYNVAFLPFLLDGVAMKKELNQADGIHPNAEGTRLMMENIYAELKPLLTK
ncbi:MAG TPA: arylesterase [Blastocatellia bacterium]|nr:arylesterase [Blastocatellia bacterium]